MLKAIHESESPFRNGSRPNVDDRESISLLAAGSREGVTLPQRPRFVTRPPGGVRFPDVSGVRDAHMNWITTVGDSWLHTLGWMAGLAVFFTVAVRLTPCNSGVYWWRNLR